MKKQEKELSKDDLLQLQIKEAELRSKKAIEESSYLTPEQNVELENLRQIYKDKPSNYIHRIGGKDNEGNHIVMFLRSISYDLRKKLFVLCKSGNYEDQITAGEMILLDCYIGGYNLYEDENTRLEASLEAISLFEFNDTLNILKKS